MKQDSAFVILHLSLIDGIGPAVIQTICDKMPESWDWYDLYRATSQDFCEIFTFSVDKAQSIVDGLADKKIVDQELHDLDRYKIGWTTILRDEYPNFLKHIHLPPALLYWQGRQLAGDERCMAIVGSRAMNWYGKKVIEQLVPPLVEYGWTVVSGGALGADSCAHRVTLEAQGKTAVVLGSGLLCP